MAENPLLPNAELRALRTWTKRAQAATSKKIRKRSKAATSLFKPAANREALLAATLMQLLPGDSLVPEPGDSAGLALVTPDKPKKRGAITSLCSTSPETHLQAAAGLAAAYKRSGSDKIVLAFAQAGLSSSTWADALTWAATEELPLVITITDSSGAEAFRRQAARDANALTWSALGKLARKLHLPILSVDGEDAVASYRVMQESVLRARSGAGPAVLWAVLSSSEVNQDTRKKSGSPLRRLERYLETRKVSF